MMNPFYSILDPQQRIESKPWRLAEGYLQVTNHAYAINNINGKKVSLIKTSIQSSIPLKILKCLSFGTIIAPLIALLIRERCRHKYQFQIIPSTKVENSKVTVETKKIKKPPSKDQPSAWIHHHDDFPTLNHVHFQESPLSRTGGFGNVGNTCFINAVVQCLKNLPHLHKVLGLDNNALPRSKDSKKDLLALKIRAKLVDIFEKSFSGYSNGQEMAELQNLMIEYSPSIKKGQMGDPRFIWDVLTEVLGLPFHYQTYDEGENEDSEWYYQITYIAYGENWKDSLKNSAINSFPYTLAVRFMPTPETANDEQGFRSSCPLEEQLEIPNNDKKKVLYRLGGVVVHRSFHYIAYLKDEKTDQWVCFNDSNVTAYKEIPKEDQDRAVFGFYQRVNEGILESWQFPQPVGGDQT